MIVDIILGAAITFVALTQVSIIHNQRLTLDLLQKMHEAMSAMADGMQRFAFAANKAVEIAGGEDEEEHRH